METTNYPKIEKGPEMKRGMTVPDRPAAHRGSNRVSWKILRVESAPKSDVSAQKPPMQKWEYCIFEIKVMHSDQDRAERVDELNKLGAAGWEPATGTISGGSQYHEYLIFKRPKS
jgi:hypothetical protein